MIYRRIVSFIFLLALFVAAGQAVRALRQHESANPARDDPAKERENELEAKRQEWFFRQRAYPQGFIPEERRVKALGQMAGMQPMLSRLGARGDSGPTRAQIVPESPATQWTLIGPQPTLLDVPPVASGRITALALDPANSKILYAGGAQGGVWKTTDGGTTWTPLTDSQPSLSIGALALDPSNDNVIYAGTGSSLGGYYGAGILKSTDGGNTWINIPGPFLGPFGPDTFFGGGARMNWLAVSPANPSVLLAAVWRWPHSAAGIYRSADGGNTWAQVFSGAPGSQVFFDSIGQHAYAAMGDYYGSSQDGVYASSDAGQTWTLDDGTGNNRLPAGANMGSITLAMAPSRSTTLYASVSQTSSFPPAPSGFFKTVDGGQNWTPVSQLPLSPYDTGIPEWGATVGVSPADPDILLAGNIDLYRSLDGGTTWADIRQGSNQIIHVDMHALAFAPDGSVVYVGHDGGVVSSTNVTGPASSLIWNNLNQQLAVTEFYPGISFNPINPQNFLIAGSQDNGTQVYSGSLTWNNVACGDGGWTAVDPQNTNNVYAECQYNYLLKSTAGGAANTFNYITGNINTNDRVAFIAPLVMDPASPQTLYFGTYRVYRTSDGAGSWAPVSSDLTDNLGSTLTTIAVAPSDSNTVYAGTDDGVVHVTSNATAGAGASWTQANTGLPRRYLSQVAVSPTDPATAYATFSGFTGFGDTLGHIFKTVSLGSSWTDISGNFPDIPVNDIAIDPDIPGTLYIATDIGVFSTDDDGQQWAPLAPGLPYTETLAVKVHSPTRTLIAATYGRSMWKLALPVISTASQPSASNLSFGQQIVGSSSAPMPLTISNAGNNLLDVSYVTLTGDFAQTNNCGPGIAAGAGCVINVVFTPTTTGTRTGALTILDNTAASPRALTVTGPGVDYSVTAAQGATTTATITAGQTASYSLLLTPLGGFSAAVSVSCTGVLPDGTCAVAPNSSNLSGGALPVSVTVTTTARSSALPQSPRHPFPPRLDVRAAFGIVILAVLLGMYRKGNVNIPKAAGIAAVALCLLASEGCGGGGPNNVPPPQQGTPASTYHLTVVAASGGATRNLQLTLVVQ